MLLSRTTPAIIRLQAEKTARKGNTPSPSERYPPRQGKVAERSAEVVFARGLAPRDQHKVAARLHTVASLSSGVTQHDERFSKERELAGRGRRARRSESAGRAFVGRADRTLPSKFHHRRRAAPLEPPGDPRVRPSEEVRGAGEP